MTRDRRIFVTNVESPPPPEPIKQPSMLTLGSGAALMIFGLEAQDASGWVGTVRGVALGLGIALALIYTHNTIRWLKLGQS